MFRMGKFEIKVKMYFLIPNLIWEKEQKLGEYSRFFNWEWVW